MKETRITSVVARLVLRNVVDVGFIVYCSQRGRQITALAGDSIIKGRAKSVSVGMIAVREMVSADKATCACQFE
jgi:hypothetical protein